MSGEFDFASPSPYDEFTAIVASLPEVGNWSIFPSQIGVLTPETLACDQKLIFLDVLDRFLAIMDASTHLDNSPCRLFH